MVIPGTIWSFQILNRVLYLWQSEAPKKVLGSTFFLRVYIKYKMKLMLIYQQCRLPCPHHIRPRSRNCHRIHRPLGCRLEWICRGKVSLGSCMGCLKEIQNLYKYSSGSRFKWKPWCWPLEPNITTWEWVLLYRERNTRATKKKIRKWYSNIRLLTYDWSFLLLFGATLTSNNQITFYFWKRIFFQ